MPAILEAGSSFVKPMARGLTSTSMSTEGEDVAVETAEGPTSDEVDAELSGPRVVVGVDDSDQAAAALRWALAEGALRQCTVEVVHSWAAPLSALPFGATFVIPVDEGEIDAAARTSVDELVDGALAHMDVRPPDVLRTILPGAPAATLVEVAQGADLLVVGSHGRTGLSRWVLGSVATACVNHAPCPVVVVRAPHDD
jgi:nucleotide-binding universal stress UspA family protein